MTEKKEFGFETKMLHAGHIPDALTGARSVPIYQSSSYVFENCDCAAPMFELRQYGDIYTRMSNPTNAVLEERLASLENGLRFYDTFVHYGFLLKLRAQTLRDTGACISPVNSFLLLQGIETLSLRMERHVSNARKVACFLNEHPSIARVHYAGLSSHPHHERARKYLPKGPGAVFSFELKTAALDAREKGRKFIEALHLFSHLANVGDARSLVIHPASTTHQQLNDEELEAAGITPATIRLSVGLETEEDLLWDLDQALHAAFI